TNAGNIADTYALSASLPANISASFSQNSVQVAPGLGNFRQVLLTLTAAQGMPPGPFNFTVKAISMANPSVTATAMGTLNVVSNGVKVGINPPSGQPGATFTMTVMNTGQVSDTFDLALGGPMAAAATLGTTSVTLAPGAQQNVTISTNAGTR